MKAGEDGAKEEARVHVLKLVEAGETLETYAKISEEGVILYTLSSKKTAQLRQEFSWRSWICQAPEGK
ncbi:conserved hypothetical protein [Ricinus communis]|uniref:Uncharacterized protein n=1 Tax=Ricinus communis TaxID=3988 RepID=B9SKN3_RICCO|nr:conserved hypothetical protein [Ricinus communis]